MTPPREPEVLATQLAAPRDAEIAALYQYWDTLRRGRSMPSREDFDPTQVPKLLRYIVLYNVVEPGSYTVRLIGEDVQDFIGRNTAGSPAASTMPPEAARLMVALLDSVVTERAPKFRTGSAYWQPDKDFRNFESCFMPLSSDGNDVNIILGAVKII